MSIQEIINEKILKEFCPNHLVVVNESHLHGGPSQDSHFKITIVSEFFSGVARVKRHQKIYKSLEIELKLRGSCLGSSSLFACRVCSQSNSP